MEAVCLPSPDVSSRLTYACNGLLASPVFVWTKVNTFWQKKKKRYLLFHSSRKSQIWQIPLSEHFGTDFGNAQYVPNVGGKCTGPWHLNEGIMVKIRDPCSSFILDFGGWGWNEGH